MYAITFVDLDGGIASKIKFDDELRKKMEIKNNKHSIPESDLKVTDVKRIEIVNMNENNERSDMNHI